MNFQALQNLMNKLTKTVSDNPRHFKDYDSSLAVFTTSSVNGERTAGALLSIPEYLNRTNILKDASETNPDLCLSFDIPLTSQTA